MSTRKSTTKPKHLQPVASTINPYLVAMQKLGLDWSTIDQIADGYKSCGSDEYLVLTIVLLKRLLNLADLKENAPESVDNYLALLIDRLYRSSHHCENAAGIFAANLDKELRERVKPRAVSERRPA